MMNRLRLAAFSAEMLFQHLKGAVRPTKPAKANRRPTARLALEDLEERWAPAGVVNTWTNASGDGLWSTVRNWSQNRVPTTNDIATFNPGVNKSDCTLNGSTTVYGLDIQQGFTNTLTLSSSTLEVTNTLNEADGTISQGILVFDGQGGGTYTWSGGTRSAIDPIHSMTVVQANAKLNIQGAANKTVDSCGFVTYGMATWSGTGGIVLNHHGTFTVATNSTFTINNAGNGVTVNGSGDTTTSFTVQTGATVSDTG